MPKFELPLHEPGIRPADIGRSLASAYASRCWSVCRSPADAMQTVELRYSGRACVRCLWSGEPRRVPLLRRLRRRAGAGRSAARGAQDGDGRLLRRDRVDGARRAARPGGDAAHDGPLLRGDPADRGAARRHGGEVHRRRGDGRVRHPGRARGRRAAGRAGGGRDPRAAGGARRGAVGRALLSHGREHGRGRGRRRRDARHGRCRQRRRPARAGRSAGRDPDRRRDALARARCRDGRSRSSRSS